MGSMQIDSVSSLFTLESGINVAPWINVVSGKFDKKNKHSPLQCANLYSKTKSFKSVIRP